MKNSKSRSQLTVTVTLCLALTQTNCSRSSGPIVSTTPDSEFTVFAQPNTVPNFWGFLTAENKGTRTVELESAHFVQLDRGLDTVGFAVTVAGENEAFLETACGPFPPSNWTTHPLRGFRVEPGKVFAIFAAVQAKTQGLLKVSGLELTYRSKNRSLVRFEFTGTINSNPTNEACILDRFDHKRP